MYAANFKYYAPETVLDAAKLLREHGNEAKILAGGMSLLPLLKMRIISVAHVVDIGKIDSLKGISEEGQKLRIGAGTTHHAIETSDVIRRKAPLLSEVASWIGDPQVRNRGTIGGALSHADPSGDWGSAVLAMGGTLEVSDGEKQRSIPSDEFFVDLFETSIGESEILTSVTVPEHTGRGSGFSYMKMERKAGDFATVGVAVQLKINNQGNCEQAGIGLTAMGAVPLRARKAETILKGKKMDGNLIDEAARAAVEDTDPSDDTLRGSAEFKKDMCEVFTRRALKTAFERAGVGY